MVWIAVPSIVDTLRRGVCVGVRCGAWLLALASAGGDQSCMSFNHSRNY